MEAKNIKIRLFLVTLSGAHDFNGISQNDEHDMSLIKFHFLCEFTFIVCFVLVWSWVS